MAYGTKQMPGKLITSDEVSRKQSLPDLSFLCLSDKDGGHHPSDPSYSTSSSREHRLTSVNFRITAMKEVKGKSTILQPQEWQKEEKRQ